MVVRDGLNMEPEERDHFTVPISTTAERGEKAFELVLRCPLFSRILAKHCAEGTS